MSHHDEMAASIILNWLGTRGSGQRPWKKVSSLARAYGAKRVTNALKHRISKSLRECGIELAPSLESLGPKDTVTFSLSAANRPAQVDSTDLDKFSSTLPDQIITWDVSNIDEAEGDDEGEVFGQWLRCLKTTQSGGRQFVWEGSSSRGIIGVVTYSGEMRNEGIYEGWGSYAPFPTPVSRRQLLGDVRTATRFGERGIKALQGLAIRLTDEESQAIVEMLGGLDPTPLPLADPDYDADVYAYFRRNNLPAEKITENAICQLPHLWHQMSLKHPPKQQVCWGSVGRLDLLSGKTVIEVKKSVTTEFGPDQIERYLGFLIERNRLGSTDVRGILVQKGSQVAPGLKRRLEKSPFPLELWSVDSDEDGEWEAIRIL